MTALSTGDRGSMNAPGADDLRAEADQLRASVSISSLIGETLPLKRTGRYLTALCPFHAEKTPSFYVYADHFHCFGCGTHGDVFTWFMQAYRMTFPEAVRRLGVADLRQHTMRPAPPRCWTPEPKSTVDLARRLWGEAVPAEGTAVALYLTNRGGLDIPPGGMLRFHPACPREAERLPAMLAPMSDPVTAAPTGVHRTFLQPDGRGKAPGSAKMMLGNAGVIRLSPDSAVMLGLGICEGIETGLTILQRAGWAPVWACGNAGMMRTFPMLVGIEALTIFPDYDDKGVGLEAARICAARWTGAGHETQLILQPAGADWNDRGPEMVA